MNRKWIHSVTAGIIRRKIKLNTRWVVGILLLCILFCFGSFHLATTGFASQLTGPFISTTLSGGSGHPEFEEMEHTPEDGRSRGKGGMGNGAENGQGESMKRPEQAQHGVSLSNAVSTFAAYASILCWFAILTASLLKSIWPSVSFVCNFSCKSYLPVL